jgi:glycosyltransferase involved in cell wall biosynthesis
MQLYWLGISKKDNPSYASTTALFRNLCFEGKMIEASIIIGTFNQAAVLKQTLESLFKQSYPSDKFEIVLIDSMSTDGTEDMLKNMRPPCRLNYIRRQKSGKVIARNCGIKEAQGEFILFTDADIPVKENWVEEHIKHQKIFKNTAFAGQTIRQRSATVTDTELPTRFKPLQKIAWPYFLTGNLSIQKETIIKAGLFDENFKEYGWEDIELGYRLHKMGVPLYFLPSALNYHYHPVSDDKFLEIMYKMGKSAVIFYKKHPNLQIKLFLGLNPIALAMHEVIARYKWLYHYIEKKAPVSPFFKHLLQQYHYLSGAKEALAHA